MLANFSIYGCYYFIYRHWFNYYTDKSCVNDIRSALSRYSEEYFHSFSITIDSGNMWTVKNESVNALETILKTITYKYEDEIKSAMKHPGMSIYYNIVYVSIFF